MPKDKVNGVNFYYEIHSNGLSLLMVQGLSENVYWWDCPMIDRLSKHFMTVFFDNRGVGRSDNLDEDVTIQFF